MAKKKKTMTPALRALDQAGVEYLPKEYKYVDHGGTAVASQAIGLEEHAVIKTLVLEDEKGEALIVLMHGDMEVSTKNLARELGVKSTAPCDPKKVNRLTGYQVGGTSPFGTRTELQVYLEETILDLERIAINGGKRGLLVEMSPQDLDRLINPTPVKVGI
jgi:Cys-tRNA(Pro) deacylase